MINNHQGIIFHIIIVLHQRCLNCSECFQRHLLCSIHAITTSGYYRNGAIKHILHESDPRRDHQQIVLLFILSLHALALHLKRLKYYFKSFCMKIWARWPYTSVGCISLQNASRTRTLLRNQILLSENIPNIWHKSSTKQYEVRPDWKR